MSRTTAALRRAGTTLGYGLVGFAGTAVVALFALNVSVRVQRVVYDVFYLQVGPSEATETAIFAHFLLAAVLALSVATTVGDLIGDRGENRRALGVAMLGLFGAVGVFLVLSLAGLAAFLTALVVLVAALLAVPVWLRYRSGVRSGAVASFLGGVPVVLLLVMLAGFGVGWGWGYVVVAEEVPASSVNGSAAEFDEAPQVRDALLEEGDCETNGDGRRECRLSLRGYDHELTAVRFMARNGVRCPYQGSSSGRNDSFVAEHDGRYYRVSCSPHGD